MTPSLLAEPAGAPNTDGRRPVRDKPDADLIARMQKAQAVLAAHPPAAMTQQEINEEIRAYRKLKRLAAAS
jgi:hypothetical protein